MKIDPSSIADSFRDEVRAEIQKNKLNIKLVGFLATEDKASEVYSEYTRKGCEDVGVEFEVRRIPRVKLENSIREVNKDREVTGVIVYYPVFGGTRDAFIRSLLSPYKDIEGLHPLWLEKLYANERVLANINQDDNRSAKALLPCTPLAIFKLLEAAGEIKKDIELPLKGKKITIFNRSEVVGRPLAFMMANDGAKVYSFDVNGVMEFSPESYEKESNISRSEALKNSDIIITGVPSNKFDLIKLSEINPDSCCLNFSSIKNFSKEVSSNVRVFIPRVGPVTVSMCLRNVLRIHNQFKDLV